jgi:Fe-S-cluster-containing dehydrogenase component
MGQQISRRLFLKGGLATAAGLAASSIPGTAAAVKPDEAKQLATLLDIRKCIGCEACVEACSEVNFGKYPDPQKPFPKMYPDRVQFVNTAGKKQKTIREYC